MIEAMLTGGGNMTKWFAVGRSTAPYLRIVDANDGSVIDPAVQPGSTVNTLDFDPFGAWLAVGCGSPTGDELIVYSVNDYSVAFSINDNFEVNAVSFSRDGAYLAVGRAKGPYLRIYETATWTLIAAPTIPGAAQSLDWSHDGNWLAVGHSGSPYLTVLNTSDWSVVAGTPTLAGTGNGVSFSPDDSFLVAVNNITSPYLDALSTSDWSFIAGTPALGGPGFSVSISPDGNHLMVGGSTSSSTGIYAFRIPGFQSVNGAPYVGDDATDCRFSKSGKAFVALGSQASIGLTKSQKIGYVADFDLGSIAGGSVSALSVY